MKKVGVFFSQPKIDAYPLSDEGYRRAYTELGHEVQQLSAEYYIVRGQSTYLGEGRFSQSWRLENGEFIEAGEVILDALFDKGVFASDGKLAVFNEDFTNQICTNKWLTYNLFKEMCPSTFLVTSRQELSNSLAHIATDLAVVKPIDGYEGKGIVIATKDQLLKQDFSYPVLVQSFLDSSGGIPGIVEGLHDLRVALIDGEIIYSYFRTPPQGSYLANVAQGGSFAVINPNLLPESVLQAVEKVEDVMAYAKHRFYSVDFAMTRKGPKIIEMNSRLGLLPNSDHQVFVTVKQKVANILVNGY